MKILGTLADQSACAYYRMILPEAELNVVHGQSTTLTMQLPVDLADPIYDVDLMVVQRIADPNISQFLRDRFDRPVIYELDDLVMHLHRSNTMAWDYYEVDNRLEVLAETMRNADALTTTTATLAEELSFYNERVFVLDNCLPNWVVNLNKPEHTGPVRIVYTGGPSHMDDVEHYRYGIGATIKVLGDRVELHTYGHPWMRELGLTDAGHVKFRPWTMDFPSYQASLCDYDIGIAPLKNTRFNRSKSAIKVYEYWAAGVVPVVSDVDPYKVVNHGVDGMVCRTNADWREAITALVEDPEMLLRMRAAGYERVADLTIEANAHKWLDAYREVAFG